MTSKRIAIKSFDISTERARRRAFVTKKAGKTISTAASRIGELNTLVQNQVSTIDQEDAYRNASNAVLEMEQELLKLRHAIVDAGMAGLRDRAKELFLLEKINIGIPNLDWRASIIYCDPPWQYNNVRHPNGARRKYDTMSDEALCSMPVPGLAAEDCVLLMWATMPRLDSAFAVMRAWGFQYKTVFTVWVKMQRYMGRIKNNNKGSYTRPNAEIVLIGVRGNPRSEQTRIDSFRHVNVLLQRPQEHSKKPEVLRRIAVELFGDLPRIELFSRQTATDWINWGNQVDGEHAVQSAPESDLHTSRNVDNVYDLTHGADVNERARRVAKRKSGARSDKRVVPGSHSVLERYDDGSCISHADYTILEDEEEEEEYQHKRARFVEKLARGVHDEDTPVHELVSSRELSKMRILNVRAGAHQRRNATYARLTDADVLANKSTIMAKQQFNADTLFAFNHNRKQLPVTHQVSQFDSLERDQD